MPVPIVPPPAPVVSATPVPAGGGVTPSGCGAPSGAAPCGGSGGVANFLSISACMAASLREFVT